MPDTEIRQLPDGRWAIYQDGIHELAVAQTREELTGERPPFRLKDLWIFKQAALFLAGLVLSGLVLGWFLPGTNCSHGCLRANSHGHRGPDPRDQKGWLTSRQLRLVRARGARHPKGGR